MAITDPSTIKFCNEQIRPAADKLARAYYRSLKVSQLWAAQPGTNDEKFVVLADSVRRAANHLRWAWRFVSNADRIWNSNNIQAVIPNDPLEEVWDAPGGGGQDPTRPPLTGQDVRRVKFRMEEFTNWLSRGTDGDEHWVLDANATLPITEDYIDDVYRLTDEAVVTPTGFQAKTLAVDRCGQIVTEWGTTNPSKFTHILLASVNPEL